MTRLTRAFVVAVLVAFGAIGIAEAQATRVVTHEDITVTNGAAVGLSSTTYFPTVNGRTKGIAGCTGRTETAKARYRYDGTAPTTTVGTQLEAGDTFVIARFEDATTILFIATTGTNVTVHVDCWTL